MATKTEYYLIVRVDGRVMPAAVSYWTGGDGAMKHSRWTYCRDMGDRYTKRAGIKEAQRLLGVFAGELRVVNAVNSACIWSEIR